MDTHFNIQQKVIHHLIIHSFSNKEIGLLNGRMGIALAFYMAGQKLNNEIYLKYADQLLDSIFNNLNKSSTFDFATGFCGLGWGIEFLIHHKLLEGNSSDICEDLDKHIMIINPMRLDAGLEYGLEGLMHYVLAHLHNCIHHNLPAPFDSPFLSSLYDSLQKIPVTGMSPEFRKLCIIYNDFYSNRDFDYEFNIVNLTGNIEVSESNYKTIPLSLKEGLAGYLVRECIHYIHS